MEDCHSINHECIVSVLKSYYDECWDTANIIRLVYGEDKKHNICQLREMGGAAVNNQATQQFPKIH